MIAKFAKILRVTGVKTGVGVLIFDVNRSRIEVGFCDFGAGLESESQKSDSEHLCFKEGKSRLRAFSLRKGLPACPPYCPLNHNAERQAGNARLSVIGLTRLKDSESNH